MRLLMEVMMARSYAETMGLEFEAERLVRLGESRAEVSRRLGVHPQTLAGWALRGGWRKKDLDLERNADLTRRTLVAIRDGNRAVDAEHALRARMRAFMREAVELLAAGDEGALTELDRRLEGVRRSGWRPRRGRTCRRRGKAGWASMPMRRGSRRGRNSGFLWYFACTRTGCALHTMRHTLYVAQDQSRNAHCG